MNNKIIKITMLNGNVVTWEANEFTDYECCEGWFYIIKNDAYVGFYNMACMSDITVSDADANAGLPDFKDAPVVEAE